MDAEDAGPAPEELIPRPPTRVDLVNLCRHLNQQEARCVVVGGFTIIHAGYLRLLWRMKRVSHRTKTAADLVFLRHWFEIEGESPPD